MPDEELPGVLDFIPKLLSPDPATWENAIAILEEEYSGSRSLGPDRAEAVTQLLEIAADPATDCRAGILALLASMAGSKSFIEIRRKNMPGGHYDSPEYDELMMQQQGWERDTKTAICPGLGFYVEMLAAVDAATRSASAHLLATFADERFGEIDPAAVQLAAQALQDRLPLEPEPLLRAGLIFALGRFAGKDFVLAEKLRGLGQSVDSAPERIALAMTAMNLPGPRSLWAVEVLTDALARWREFESVFESSQEPPLAFQWFFDNLPAEWLRSLCALDSSYTDRILPALEVAVRDFKSPDMAGKILDHLFQGGKVPAHHQALTAPQRQILNLLFDQKTLFRPQDGNALIVQLRLGLPDSPWKWERLLGRPETDPQTEGQS